MAEVEDKPVDEKSPGTEADDAFDDLYGLTEEVADAVDEALSANDQGRIRDLLEPLHAADIADLMERLTSGERETIVDSLGKDMDPEILAYMDYSVREDIVDYLDTDHLASLVTDMETDDAIDLLEDLDAADQQELLDALPADDRLIYEQGLSYPEDSAGRLMRHEAVTVPEFWSVGQTIDYMRSDESDLPDDFYNLIVIDPGRKPVGTLQLSKLLSTRRPVALSEIMEPDPKLIPLAMDQEDVAFFFRQYGLVEAPVVDDSGRLLGSITIDDIVDVLDEEHEDDMLKLGGVHEDDFYSDVAETTRLRFSWLLVNLVTAILASLVISAFEATIEQIVALAVLMPIVASMGGNAGTQTLTVAVRALAVNELTTANAMRIVLKEILVGGVNGIVFALIMGVIVWLWFGDPMIGVVIAVAMVVNLLIAGFAGTMIPLALDRLKIDPAVASTVVLTTVTDVVGFFAFLGLAATVLL
ncbi:magnesium transporter [Hwanghaeella grinnelliae]|uniref:Magnesium transporter MgtE n=1 Tax=Hwanghaeella grinnelliae TaxID=2500179 RepID=A0A437QJI1_9PROT|nr:magnesium transporter [Hwanghaeella grinnelliae]RVU34661.1 magnesium transporter [Hwanghaeella grinnelliae]